MRYSISSSHNSNRGDRSTSKVLIGVVVVVPEIEVVVKAVLLAMVVFSKEVAEDLL